MLPSTNLIIYFIITGKTALHWAAAVNNVEAVQVLLAHGANRDAQDVKEETPLFLAAREGSFEAVKMLLEHFANRDITDHMDRLPRDVAMERMHTDIVRLLDDYMPASPQINMQSNGPMGSPGMMQQGGMMGSTKSVKQKKRPKLNTIAGLPMKDGDFMSSEPSIVRRKSSVKKRKEPPPMLIQGIDGSMTLSPVNSLESPRTTSYMEGTPPPLESLYNGHMGMSHQNLINVDGSNCMTSKQPPSYEDCINAAAHIYDVMGMDALSNFGSHNFGNNNGMMNQQQQQQQPKNMKPNHPRQNSMPSNMSQNLTIPTYTMSATLNKQRPSLPTSPTHMAAMRAAHHQKTVHMQSHQQPSNTYDYPPMTDLHCMLTAQSKTANNNSSSNNLTYQQQGHSYHYPTPPSQHSQPEMTPQHYLLGPETYLTPSPESPGQWSSSSPHSAQSDWSEGIHSPMDPNNMHPSLSVSDQQQKSQTQQVQQSHMGAEAVFI